MANDTQRSIGVSPAYQDDRDKSNLINHPVLGIVKDNIDPTHNGRIRVYVSNYGGQDPDKDTNWIWVNYLSPWFGGITPKKDTKNPDSSKYGEFVGNPISYGMWASAPDIGTTVICIFIDGKRDQGYYIGSPPIAGIHQMVPAMGSAKFVVPNSTEATTYGGAKLLPTSEVNINDKAIRNSTAIYAEPKPVHSYQAAILNQQGLIRDSLRGTISSSSQRETPSRVFGISTPGGSIYEGGYTNNTIKQAIKTADISKVQLAGRVGGHSIVLDDGTIDGQDQLMRFRTSAGHTIMMNDTGQNIFIIHSNGQSWVELGKEGTIDIWSSNSFNVRTLGDINLHADRDVNIHAGRNLNMFGNSIKVESDTSMSVKTNTDYSAQHGGKYSMNAGATMSLKSGGNAGFNSGGVNFINGSFINLNTGVGPAPDTVDPITKNNHKDTIYSQQVGWTTPGPNPLVSITSRATTHQPYAAANLGVDIKITGQVSQVGSPATTPSTAVQAVNNNTPGVPDKPVAPAVTATSPVTTPAVTNQGRTVVPASTVAAAVNQQAATVANFTPELQIGQGTIPGTVTGINTKQAVEGGVQKPGTEQIINEMIGQGIPYEQSAALAMTGLRGISSPGDLLNNVPAQVETVAASLQKTTTNLINSGTITGQESPGSITGIIAAGSRFGSETVVNLTKNIGSAVSSLTSGIQSAITGAANKVSGIGEMISSGNFAAAITDNLKLATSAGIGVISGLFGGNGAKSSPTVAQLSAGLRQQSTQEFLAKESEYTAQSLKPGQPNDLSGASIKNRTDVNTLKSTLEKTDQLKSELISLKALASTSENVAKVAEIEKRLAEAEKQSSQTFSQIISDSTEAASAVNDAADIVKGQNPIAGLRQLGTTLENRALGAAGTVTRTVAKAIDGLKSFADPSKLAGNLLQKSTDALGNISIVGKIGKLFGFGGGGGGGAMVQNAVSASDTFDKSAIVAKTGQLLGDPIVPPPVFGPPTDVINTDEYLREQNALLDRIETLSIEIDTINIRLAAAYEVLSDPNAGVQAYSQIDSLKQELATVQARRQLAENEYDQLINR